MKINKIMKLCFTSLMAGEIKSQPQWFVTSPKLEWLLSGKKAANSSSTIISKLITAIMENNKDVPQKAKNRITL